MYILFLYIYDREKIKGRCNPDDGTKGFRWIAETKQKMGIQKRP